MATTTNTELQRLEEGLRHPLPRHGRHTDTGQDPCSWPCHFPATVSVPQTLWALLTLGAGGILGHLAPEKARLTALGLGMDTRVGLLLQETARAGVVCVPRRGCGQGSEHH